MDNYNYPMGADTKDAPWKENNQPEKLFGIIVSCSLSKDVGVTSIDYDSDDKLNCPWKNYAASEYTPSRITIKVADNVNVSENIDGIFRANHLKESECAWMVNNEPLDDEVAVNIIV